MGIQEVKKEILDNAKAQAKEILKEADKEKSEILTTVEDKLALAKSKIESDADRSIEQYRTMALAEGNSQVKKQKLSVEKQMIDDIFVLVKEELANLPAKKREQHLSAILAGVKDFEIGRVYCSKKDMEFLKKYKPVESDIIGGVIVEDKDGETRIDQSYEVLLENLKQETLPEITKIIM